MKVVRPTLPQAAGAYCNATKASTRPPRGQSAGQVSDTRLLGHVYGAFLWRPHIHLHLQIQVLRRARGCFSDRTCGGAPTSGRGHQHHRNRHAVASNIAIHSDERARTKAQYRQRRKSSEGGNQGRRCRKIGNMTCIAINLLAKVLLLLMNRSQPVVKFHREVFWIICQRVSASLARAADRFPLLVATERSSIAVGRRW